MRFFSTVWAAVLAATLSACGGGGASPAEVANVAASAGPVEAPALVARVESYQPPATERPQIARQEALAADSKADRPTPFAIRLPAAAARRALELRRAPGVPVQVGIAREVAATADRAGMGRSLKWRHGPRRAAAAMSFTSEGAAGLRLGLVVRKLPAGAVIRGYAQGADTAFEIPARTILETIERNRVAGDLSDAGRTFWTPLVDGQELTLEISVPPGSPVDAVDVSIPRLSHLQVKSTDLNTPRSVGEAGTCERDVSCFAEADDMSRSTARMIFTTSTGTFLCTGTLLNDSSSSGTPYLLSANHCISSQTTASTLITHWFFRSTSCDSGVLNSTGLRALYSGADLLYASSATDTSFLKLNEAPPAGTVFAGWSVDAPAIGADVATVHHPEGDLQKYSQGSVSAFANCTSATSSDSFTCSLAGSSNATFMNANWLFGTTEVGSSGAGLFASGNGKRYLVGQLYGGSASCAIPGGTSWYGRFDKAYSAALSRWLSPAGAQAVTQRIPVYRFYNATTGAHFFTQSAEERDGVIATLPQFNYEGVAFYAYGSQVPGSSPIFRFYNTRTGRHFYTIHEGERDLVLANLPDYKYEGLSWYAQKTSGGDAAEVFRFYNASREAHFYTINALEKDWIIQSNPAWRYEGVGYYAWTTQ